MSSYFLQQRDTVKIEPVPELSNIAYSGDGRFFLVNGNSGKYGIVKNVFGEYNNDLIENFEDEEYSKFFCDYLVTKKIKLQGSDVKVSGAGSRDFLIFEVLYLYDQSNDIWVLGKRFVHRFYLQTDFEDQDTPNLPYGKILDSGRFIIRVIYCKHKSNGNEVHFRQNYVLHEVVE